MEVLVVYFIFTFFTSYVIYGVSEINTKKNVIQKKLGPVILLPFAIEQSRDKLSDYTERALT